MIQMFPPSTIPHPWRTTLAYFAVAVWIMVGAYYLAVWL